MTSATSSACTFKTVPQTAANPSSPHQPQYTITSQQQGQTWSAHSQPPSGSMTSKQPPPSSPPSICGTANANRFSTMQRQATSSLDRPPNPLPRSQPRPLLLLLPPEDHRLRALPLIPYPARHDGRTSRSPGRSALRRRRVRHHHDARPRRHPAVQQPGRAARPQRLQRRCPEW